MATLVEFGLLDGIHVIGLNEFELVDPVRKEGL